MGSGSKTDVFGCTAWMKIESWQKRGGMKDFLDIVLIDKHLVGHEAGGTLLQYV